MNKKTYKRCKECECKGKNPIYCLRYLYREVTITFTSMPLDEVKKTIKTS